MNYNFKRKLNATKIISASIALVILLGGCSVSTKSSMEQSSSTISAVNDNSVTNINSTTEQSTQEINQIQETSLETQIYTCPIDYNDSTLMEFAQYMEGCGYSTMESNLPMNLGYDNPALQQMLIEFTFNKTGEYNNNITVDSFHYFQYGAELNPSFGATSQNNPSEFLDRFSCLTPSEWEVLNSVLIQTNSRFIIDEIPYSYFEERFPEFVSDLSAENYNNIGNQYVEIMDRVYNYETCNFEVSDLNDYEYDIFLFCTCAFYNRDRNMIFQSCQIPQVRNQNTGRLELNPNDLQLTQLNNTFGEFVGGDVMQVETREHFYETYGMYPEDALYRETRYEGNLTESNSMYSEAPSRQR